MAEIDLPDINVWLALTCEDHPHHRRARRYWDGEGAPRLAFCRVTMLGLLRLATNPKVMQNQPFTPVEAWQMYRNFRALPEVLFLAESAGLDAAFSANSELAAFRSNRWTDAYLAAFAEEASCRLVSFDSDFHAFPAVEFLHLQAG